MLLVMRRASSTAYATHKSSNLFLKSIQLDEGFNIHLSELRVSMSGVIHALTNQTISYSVYLSIQTHLQSLLDTRIVPLLHSSKIGLLQGRQLRLGPDNSQRDAIPVRGAVSPSIVKLWHLPGLQLSSALLTRLQMLPGRRASHWAEGQGQRCCCRGGRHLLSGRDFHREEKMRGWTREDDGIIQSDGKRYIIPGLYCTDRFLQ